MITIGTLKVDLQAGQEPFVRDLYGRWEDFNRASLEKVVDEVLSRYDTEDELIRVGSLDLDLGEIEEADFYERFPRKLAERLDDIFTSYLRNKEEHPDKIAVVPIKQSWLDIFEHYMLRGYWPLMEGERLTLPGLLDKLLPVSPEDVNRFLREYGNVPAIRKRLVFQLDDSYQERLVSVAVPSESSFIIAYTRFLRANYVEINRPDIRRDDYRNAVWLVVWSYLLSREQGYFNRKQMVANTLRELAGYYNLSFRDLLGMLTRDLDKFASTLLFMPELLSLLEDIRKDTFSEMKPDENISLLSLEELRALLAHRESSFAYLSKQGEERIYRIAERVIPEESSFVINYAKALDKERELGMLEGKAGTDFRVLKWVFIFEVIVGMRGSGFERRRFALSVLKELAARYNLTVLELLGYFYRTLTDGRFSAGVSLRELIVALYLDALEESPADVIVYYPVDLRERLSNPAICRRFVRSLREEQIYPMVRQIIPSESPFIIRYAQTLDKGKERGRFEGMAGSEFRILKWEFIFLILFSAPLSAFSRKQFVRSVLGQLASHYNVRVRELISYFYEGTLGESPWVPEEIREVIGQLYEDMTDESPEPLLSDWLMEERKAYQLGRFILTGDAEVSLAALSEYVNRLERTNPKALLDQLQALKQIVPTGIPLKEPVEAARIFATFLLLVICECGLAFPGLSPLTRYLTNVMENRTFGDAARLRLLLHYCMVGDMAAFSRIQEPLLGAEPLPELPPSTASSIVHPFNFARKELLERLVSTASSTLRLVAEELIRLFHLESFGLDELVWLNWLSSLSDDRYRNYSVDGLFFLFWNRLIERIPEKELHAVESFILRHKHNLPGFSGFLHQLKNNMDMEIVNDSSDLNKIIINNAGLVLVAPYLPVLFRRLGYWDNGRRGFNSKEIQIRAIFVIQRFVTDDKKICEPDLFLNRLFTGYDLVEPLPSSCDLTDNELELISQLKKAILDNWDKMRHTSWQGFQGAFLKREGIVSETENSWTLKVEERAYDILLDSLPWGYKMIKFPWMEKMIKVDWR